MKKYILLLFIMVFSLSAQDKELFDQDLVRKNIKHYLSNSVYVCTRFLYDKECNNYNYISEHSKFRLYFDNTIDENGKLKMSLSLRAKVKLPKINNKLFFTLDKESTSSQENREQSEIRDLTSDNNTRVGLKYYFINENDTKIYTKLGAKLRLSSKSDIYLKAGATNLKRFNKFQLYSYLNQYYYIRQEKLITQVGSNIIKKFNTVYTLSLNNEISLETDKNNSLSNTIILEQHLGNSSIFSYWATLSSNFRDNIIQSESISINSKYQSMINDWVFYEISPSIVKTLQEDKKISKYLRINFGFIF